MKWRKWAAIPLVLILCLGLLAGCGESKEDSKSKDVSIEEVKEESAPAAADEKSEPAAAEEEPAKEEKAPEEDVTAESLLNGYYDIADDIGGMAFNMQLILDMKMAFMETETAMSMDMDVHYETDGKNVCLTGTMETTADGETESEELEQYLIDEDGKVVTYTYDKETDSWTTSESAEIQISKEMIPKIKNADYSLEETKDQYVVSGNVEMKELMESSGEAMNEMFGDLMGGSDMEFVGKADIEYHFNKETKALEEVDIDMASVVEETFKALFEGLLSMQGEDGEEDLSEAFKMTVDSFKLNYTDIVIDDDIKVVLPEEAKEAKSTGSAQAAAEFESFTPVDTDECTVTVTDLDPEGDWGYTIDLMLENKSADVKYNYSVEQVFVNGLAANAYLYEEIVPGKKASSEITIDSEKLAGYGIDAFTDIEIAIRVQNADDWSEAPVVEETFHIYPYGEEKAEKYVREAQASDVVLVDENKVSMILTGQGMDDGDYKLDIFIENNTDDILTIEADDFSVNGFMADPYYYVLIYPGKCTYQSMTWSESDLEKNKITDVEEIEGTLVARIYGEWSDPVFSKTVTITP